MKVILSRKGFDTASGGCPSPVFPDGSMLALPIPDKNSALRYRDLRWRGRDLSALMRRLPGAKPEVHHGAHLDPDLCADTVARPPGWRPIFGQRGSAQGHLRNEGVGAGDIFLFFGLFRAVTKDGTFAPGSPRRHIIWGWMQVAEVVPVDLGRGRLAWASYHPHLTCGADPTNVVYLGADRLRVQDYAPESLPGAGVFMRFIPQLQLTASDSSGPSVWRLPTWFQPSGTLSALSYHRNPDLWTRDGDNVLLRTVGRGQEFVIDVGACPEVVSWALAMVVAGCHADPR